MRRGLAVALIFGAWVMGSAVALAGEKDGKDEKKARVNLRDDCDPTDPGWTPTGGCALEQGDVSFSEFGALLVSPLSLSVVGHPAWRMDPAYFEIEPDEIVKVKNKGGRRHTFTEVANFGGGFVPPLNIGLTPAPECNPAVVGPTELAPGASLKVTGLSAGIHRFQCCIHPWMRMLIRVEDEESSKGEKQH